MKAQDISADRLRDFFNTFAELMEQMTGSNPQGISIKTVAEEMLIAKARAGKSPAYLKTLRAQTASAFKGNLRKSIAEVTLPDMEKWFFRSEYARRTQRNFGLAARTLFSFAQKRGYVRNNVAEGLEMPTLENRPVEIMPVEHVALALHTAQKTDLNLCRLLAIQFFAGLRTSEAHRLIESEIGERFIEVKAEKCKTRRRMVTIQPALRAWLSIGGELPCARPRECDKAQRWLILQNISRDLNFVTHNELAKATPATLKHPYLLLPTHTKSRGRW